MSSRELADFDFHDESIDEAKTEPLEIKKRKLILVEGDDDKRVLEALLKTLKLDHNIQVLEFGGINKYREYVRTLPGLPKFRQVESLGIILDADKNAQSAMQRARDGLANAKLPAPKKPLQILGPRPQTSVFVWPDCESPGTLETLCLSSVEDHAELTCIESFLACIKTETGYEPQNGKREKAKLQSFLATHPKKPFRLIGDAADANVWPWDHPAFDLIKEFLRSL